jgi:hypothetical protein
VSISIEVVPTRVHHCDRAYLNILKDCNDLLDTSTALNVAFCCVDVLNVRSLAYFDVVYMFDCGLSPELLGHIASVCGKGRNKWLVSYHDSVNLERAGFRNLRLLTKISNLRFSGSKSTRTAYFYSVESFYLGKRSRHEPHPDEAIASAVQLALSPYNDRYKLISDKVASFSGV